MNKCYMSVKLAGYGMGRNMGLLVEKGTLILELVLEHRMSETTLLSTKFVNQYLNKNYIKHIL